MTTLSDALTSEEQLQQVVEDCRTLIDEEVASKSGFSGMAIKAGYKAVKGIKPGFIQKVIRDLLPEFARVLDPVYQDAKSSGSAVSSYFNQHSGRVADALLSITDGKADRSTNGLIKGTYKKLRSSAKSNVEAAVPRLGALIEKYTR